MIIMNQQNQQRESGRSNSQNQESQESGDQKYSTNFVVKQPPAPMRPIFKKHTRSSVGRSKK